MKAIRITATGTVYGQPAEMAGFYISSTSAGTLIIKDGGASGDQKSGTITPAIGWHDFPLTALQSFHATISGALDITFFMN